MSKTLGSSALGLSPVGVERECWCRGSGPSIPLCKPHLRECLWACPFGPGLVTGGVASPPAPCLFCGSLWASGRGPGWPRELAQRGTERGRLPPLVSQGSRRRLLGGTGLTRCTFRERPGTQPCRPQLTSSETFVPTVLIQEECRGPPEALLRTTPHQLGGHPGRTYPSCTWAATRLGFSNLSVSSLSSSTSFGPFTRIMTLLGASPR